MDWTGIYLYTELRSKNVKKIKNLTRFHIYHDHVLKSKLFFPSAFLHFIVQSEFKRVHLPADVSHTCLQKVAQEKAIQQVFLSEELTES